MLGFKLLSSLFARDKDKEVETVVGAIKAAAIEVKPAISEPVISLAKSILETDDWVLEVESDRYSTYKSFSVKTLTFRHKHKALEVGYIFTFEKGTYPDYETTTTKSCNAEWMTVEEREFMMTVLKDYETQQQEKAERERQRQLAAEREKFMVLVTNEGETK